MTLHQADFADRKTVEKNVVYYFQVTLSSSYAANDRWNFLTFTRRSILQYEVFWLGQFESDIRFASLYAFILNKS